MHSCTLKTGAALETTSEKQDMYYAQAMLFINALNEGFNPLHPPETIALNERRGLSNLREAHQHTH